MKAMIFAAGLGTRLKPYTTHHPKALVEVCGEPMLKRVILKLKDAGISEFVVNVHHFAEQIIEYLHVNDNFGVTIHVSDERELLLDTGGGILAARRWLETAEEPFVVHNADILTDISVSEMERAHIASQAQSTLLVASRATKRYLLFDSDMRMQGWTNISTGQTRPATVDAAEYDKYAFGGVHIMSPEIFTSLEKYREPNTPFSITDYYIDHCQDIKICGYMQSGKYYWHDIGKPETLTEAENTMRAMLLR